MKHAVYVIRAGCLWGIISIFVNCLKDIGFNSIQCVAIRAFFTALILFVYLLITDKEKLKIARKDIKYFIGTGICSNVFFNYCYFEAIEEIGSVAIPSLLLYTAPIFVMFLSALFFREKITRKKIAALLLTFAGLGFVTGAFTGGEKVSITTLLLGLGAGFGYALYSIFGKLVINKYDAVTIIFYTFAVAALGVVPMSGVVPKIVLFGDVKCIMATFGISFVSTVIPFLLYTKGLQGMEAGNASIFATVELFVATIIGVLLFGEKFTLSKGIGMMLIIMAIVYLNLEEPFRKK